MNRILEESSSIVNEKFTLIRFPRLNQRSIEPIPPIAAKFGLFSPHRLLTWVCLVDP